MERVSPQEFRKLKSLSFKAKARWKRDGARALLLRCEGLSYRTVAMITRLTIAEIKALEEAYQRDGLAIFEGDPVIQTAGVRQAMGFIEELLKTPPPTGLAWTPLEVERRLEVAGLGDELDSAFIAKLCRRAKA